MVTASTSEQHEPFSNSSAAVGKAQPHTSSLLTRSGNKQHSFLQHESTKSRTTGICSPESNEFKLSPIHTRTVHTGPGVAANRGVISDENSSILSSESASSTSEAKGVTLTPLHAKKLTTSDLFRNTPVHDKAKATAVSEGRLATTTLSPLHAKDSSVLKQYASDPQSPERKPVAAGSGPLAIGLSPVHTKLSSSRGRQLKVTEPSSPTHKQGAIDSSLLMQLRDTEKDTRHKSDIPTESAISIPEDNLGPTPDQSQSIEHSVEVESPEDSPVASSMKPLSEADKSGLGEDLAELQSALQAAGLPPVTVKDEETPKGKSMQSSESPKVYYSVDIGTKDAKIPQSSASISIQPDPLSRFTGDHSEPDKQASVKRSGEQEHPGAMGFDLREAIRAIASEELTSISKKILKQQKHSVSQPQQPLPINHETASASNNKKSERGTESFLPQGDGEASHATYEGLEKLSDLLADIEHDSESQESVALHEDSKKPGLSSATKSTSTLPKTNTKPFASKQGPSSKVDSRLSSKVKAGVRTSSTSKSSYKTSSRLAELAAPRKVNKAPSTTSVGNRVKPKTQPQSFRPGTSKSAPPKQLSSGCTSLKQHCRTIATKPTPKPTGSSKQHQIVIPTGSNSALESQSDSEDEVILAAHEGGKKTNNERPEIKMDAWKKALQEEKVCLNISLEEERGTWPRD